VNLTLTRAANRADGVFGRLTDESDKQIAVTLEHSYMMGEGGFGAKIPVGEYTCKRSSHRLHGMTSDFITFQVMDVPNHNNILFHWGNYNQDSDGCILLGRNIEPGINCNMITHSRDTWQAFMNLQNGLNEFTLTVKG